MRHRAAGKPKSPAASMARLSVVFAAGGSGLPVGAQKSAPKQKRRGGEISVVFAARSSGLRWAQKSAPKQKGGDDLNSRQNVNATKLLAHSASGVRNCEFNKVFRPIKGGCFCEIKMGIGSSAQCNLPRLTGRCPKS